MDIKRSLAIFRLKDRISVQQLNLLFRELVKKYHPDKVRDYPDWAHERMFEINDAYETIVEWLANPLAESSEISDSSKETQNHQADDSNSEIKPLSDELEIKFRTSFNKFLDGLAIYYQYGLENHEYRQVGIRRFRFREAIRLIMEGRNELEFYRYQYPVFRIAARFARLTAADIGIAKPRFNDKSFFHKIDARLNSARRNFDDAIKEIFFPEIIPNYLKGRATVKLYTCYATFLLYMSIFVRGERRKIGILMSARYDALMELMELKARGLVSF